MTSERIIQGKFNKRISIGKEYQEAILGENGD